MHKHIVSSTIIHDMNEWINVWMNEPNSVSPQLYFCMKEKRSHEGIDPRNLAVCTCRLLHGAMRSPFRSNVLPLYELTHVSVGEFASRHHHSRELPSLHASNYQPTTPPSPPWIYMTRIYSIHPLDAKYTDRTREDTSQTAEHLVHKHIVSCTIIHDMNEWINVWMNEPITQHHPN